MSDLDDGKDIELDTLDTDQVTVAFKVRETPPKIDLTEVHQADTDTTPTKDGRIDYEILHWIFIIFFTLITVIDRFTVNLWPLWVDSPGPTIPGNFSVSVFALIAWISSRMMIVSSSYIFLFQCRIFWNWFVEQPKVNKYLKIGDIMQSNFTLHYHVGWALIGIPVVLHVWAIAFAAVFPQNSVKLYPNWMRPKNPDGTSISFYADNLLSLGVNDVYRIVSTSVTFFILIPFSIINCTKNTNWSRAQWMHMIGALIYTIDLMRMKSHPHCWVFNTPFILWWVCDRVYGIFWYRRCVAQVINKVMLDDDHAVMYLKVPRKLYAMRAVGDVFYFNFLDPHWDKAHPFTIFWNHKARSKMMSDEELEPAWTGHKFHIHRTHTPQADEDSVYLMSRQSTKMSPVTGPKMSVLGEKKEEDDDKTLNAGYDWDLAIVMQVFPCREGFQRRKTWTSEVVKGDVFGLRAWGPYRSEYRVLRKDVNQPQYPSTSTVLIGTGCGAGYLVDYYQYITSNNLTLDVAVYFYFSTRSIAMFQWFTDITCAKHIDNLFVNAHLTSHDNKVTYHQKESSKAGKKSRDSRIGRMSIQEILTKAPANTQVFYCGSPNVQNMVCDLCKKRNLTFHAGHSFY